jgi:hypothetical protein
LQKYITTTFPSISSSLNVNKGIARTKEEEEEEEEEESIKKQSQQKNKKKKKKKRRRRRRTKEEEEEEEEEEESIKKHNRSIRLLVNDRRARVVGPGHDAGLGECGKEVRTDDEEQDEHAAKDEDRTPATGEKSTENNKKNNPEIEKTSQK